MSDAIGPIAVLPSEGSGSLLPGRQRDLARQTQRLVDEEVRRIVDDAHAEVTELLTAHRDQLETPRARAARGRDARRARRLRRRRAAGAGRGARADRRPPGAGAGRVGGLSARAAKYPPARHASRHARRSPRNVAEPPHEPTPHGRWADRLRAEFLAAAQDLATTSASPASWPSIRTAPGTATPTSRSPRRPRPTPALRLRALRRRDRRARPGRLHRLRRLHRGDRRSATRTGSSTSATRSSAAGTGRASARASMTLVWGRALVTGGAVATAELGETTVDQCALAGDRFTLLAPDDYAGALLEVRLYTQAGEEIARESLYDDDDERRVASAAPRRSRRALVVQWIRRPPPKRQIQVRLLAGASPRSATQGADSMAAGLGRSSRAGAADRRRRSCRARRRGRRRWRPRSPRGRR